VGKKTVFLSLGGYEDFQEGIQTHMTDDADKRGQLSRHLEDALAVADEIDDGQTGFLIERALDEARSRQFRPIG